VPSFDRHRLAVRDYEIEDANELWQRFEIVPTAAVRPNARVVGGADSSLAYSGTDQALAEYLKSLGIGVDPGESCFLYALRQSGRVDSDTLTNLATVIRAQFLTLKQALMLLD
jgi:hypothetical protein